MRIHTILTFGAAAALAGATLGQSPANQKEKAKSLSIGDRAPAIDITHWVKGDPVETFEADKVYIMEFWATWCGPCRASMPHISDVQSKYRDYDVRFVGVSDEKLPTVVEFLTQERGDDGKLWYDIIQYTLTTDPDRSVFDDYMKAAGQNGIPTAFIVGKSGQIEWIGHPMSIDAPLDAVVRGTWNRESFKQEFEAKRDLTALMRSGNHDEALKKIDVLLEKADPDQAGPLLWQKFNLLLIELDRPREAYAIGGDLIEQHWENSSMLNSIAWTVVDNPDVKERNLPFAMKTAKRACELTDYEDGMILDTLARVYFEQGDLAKAIEWQRKAVEHTEPGATRESLQKTLQTYEDKAGG